MEEPKYKDWILETIDQLRKRKARPDLERICHMVERKHGPSFEEIVTDLEKLVAAGIVFKVDYKGNTSYRNAAKWKRGAAGSQNNNSSEVSRRILDAVRSLTEPMDSGSEGDIAGGGGGGGGRQRVGGVSFGEIENWMEEDDPDTNLVENALQTALEREVEVGCLKKLANGNFLFVSEEPTIVKPKHRTPQKNNSKSSKSATKHERDIGAESTLAEKIEKANKTTSPGKKSRTSSKRKKLKRCLDPDFEVDPELERGSGRKHSRKESSGSDKYHSKREPSSGGAEVKGRSGDRKVSNTSPPDPLSSPRVMDDKPRCDFCLNTAEKNKQGQPEDLLICRECQAKAHPSCMDYSEDLAKRARNSPWQCIDCKTCYICEDAGDPDAMLFCDACDKGYHMTCHKPPIEDKPTGKWVCSKCEEELGLEAEDAEMRDAEEAEDEAERNPIDPMDEETEEEGEEEEEEEEEEEDREDSESTVSKQQVKHEEYNADGGPSCLPTPNASPVHFKVEPPEPTDSIKPKIGHMIHAPLPKLADTMTAEVPDASQWSIEDVVGFFKAVGFIEQCEVFREQEIDGKSLLLMKRSDVLQGLSLRLGPALKIYAHVQRLQTKGQILL